MLAGMDISLYYEPAIYEMFVFKWPRNDEHETLAQRDSYKSPLRICAPNNMSVIHSYMLYTMYKSYDYDYVYEHSVLSK